MHENGNYRFIFLADFNCNIYEVNHVYSKLIRGLMEKHNLISCFDLKPNFDYNSSYTRFDKKIGSFTLIDGILISEPLKQFVNNVN